MTFAHPEQEYFEFLKAGKLMIQQCEDTGEFIFYPRVIAPRSGSARLKWVQVSGNATVHAATVMRPKAPEPPYNVVMVELAEGPRMISRVEMRDPTAVKIGMKVRARIVNNGDKDPVLVFDPVDAALALEGGKA